MNAKISVTCYRSKILSNGEAPLMVKITKNGKRSLKTMGISLNPKYWDFERDKPKSNCPNRTYIVSIITNALQKYQAIQLDMEAKNEDYTASEILADTASKTELVTVEDFLTSHIQQLRDNGKVGRKEGYKKSDEKFQEEYAAVIKQLRKGYPIRIIASSCGVGISTVQRIKKKFIDNENKREYQ